MVHWKDASESDEFLYTAIAELFRNNKQLLEFFFHPSKPKLAFSCKKIKQLARSFCSGDELLIRIALDIWSESGGGHFNEIYQKLDEKNFMNVLSVIGKMHGNKIGHSMLRQLKTDIIAENFAN